MFHIHNSILYRDDKIYVPSEHLRTRIMSAHHDEFIGGHFGIKKTLVFLQEGTGGQSFKIRSQSLLIPATDVKGINTTGKNRQACYNPYQFQLDHGNRLV